MAARSVIGIIANLDFERDHPAPGQHILTTPDDCAHAVLTAGGVPLILPPTDDLAALEVQMPLLDGLLLTGGPDVDPQLYGQDPQLQCQAPCPVRDRYELAALQIARERALPTLGIGRGLQIINVFAGGTLHQDLSLTGTTQQHQGEGPPEAPVHRVTLTEDGFLSQLWSSSEARVNSRHHQAIDRLGWQLKVAARAADQTIEAVQWTGGDFPLIAVQWHPESMVRTSTKARTLFVEFVAMCHGKSEPNSPRRSVAR